MSAPLVSCVMVTRNRAWLARRAVHCFAEQTWANKELVILDDGTEDYGPTIAPYAELHRIAYHRVAPEPGRLLGGLRNHALDLASGEFVVQWDDDEWYHPTRVEMQMRAVEEGLDAVVFTNALHHLDTPELVEHAFHTSRTRGSVPGTLLHRRGSARYPNLARAEDTAFLEALRAEMRVGAPKGPHTHLFIRCFHGENTWDLRHFLGSLKLTPLDRFSYVVAQYLRRDLTRHRAFRLTDLERESARLFLAQSRSLGVLKN